MPRSSGAHPHHRVGWLLVVSSVFNATFTDALLAYGRQAALHGWPAAAPAQVVALSGWMVAALGLVLLFLWFPDGRVSGPGRWIPWVWALGALLGLPGWALNPRLGPEFIGHVNPYAASATWTEVLFLSGTALVVAALLASVVVFVLRFRTFGGSRAPPAEMDGLRRYRRRRRTTGLDGAVDGVATRPAARRRGFDPPPGGHVGGDLALPPLRRRPHRQPHRRVRRDHRPAGGDVRRGGRPRGCGPVLTGGGRRRCVRRRGRVPAGPRPDPGDGRPPIPARSLRDAPSHGRLRRRPPSGRGVRRRPGGSAAGGCRRADVHRRLRHRDRGLARHPRPAGRRRRSAPGPHHDRDQCAG